MAKQLKMEVVQMTAMIEDNVTVLDDSDDDDGDDRGQGDCFR